MPQEDQSFVRDVSTGTNLALMAIFSVNRTVQIWSRVPGTTGPWFLGLLFFGGILIQGWYFEINVQATGQSDWIPFGAVTGLSLIWFAFHSLKRTQYQTHGPRIHSYSPGTGILVRFVPGWQNATIGLVSDLSMALALSFILRIFNCPIFSSWYACMCIWLLASHLFFQVRDSWRRRAWDDASIDAEYWSDQVRRS